MTLLACAIQNQTNHHKIAVLCPCSNKTALRLRARDRLGKLEGGQGQSNTALVLVFSLDLLTVKRNLLPLSFNEVALVSLIQVLILYLL